MDIGYNIDYGAVGFYTATPDHLAGRAVLSGGSLSAIGSDRRGYRSSAGGD